MSLMGLWIDNTPPTRSLFAIGFMADAPLLYVVGAPLQVAVQIDILTGSESGAELYGAPLDWWDPPATGSLPIELTISQTNGRKVWAPFQFHVNIRRGFQTQGDHRMFLHRAKMTGDFRFKGAIGRIHSLEMDLGFLTGRRGVTGSTIVEQCLGKLSTASLPPRSKGW